MGLLRLYTIRIDLFKGWGTPLHVALASDKIAFNSAFNRDSFFDGCLNYLRSAADMHFDGIIEELRQKAVIINPGIDFSRIDRLKWKNSTDIPVIVWNHRWEHDKNPDDFFQALDRLEQRGIDFRLIILGQSFASVPSCFNEAKGKFKDRIIHYGFVMSSFFSIIPLILYYG